MMVLANNMMGSLYFSLFLNKQTKTILTNDFDNPPLWE